VRDRVKRRRAQQEEQQMNRVEIRNPPLTSSSTRLHKPLRESACALERALHERRSVREFGAAPLSPAAVSQLLWSAQGVSHDGHRTAPSAGALYPLALYLVAGHVRDLAAGVYRYEPAEHRLSQVAAGDRRNALAEAAQGQRWIADAAAILAIAAVERRTAVKYGNRGVRYIHMEAGHAGQNVLLQAAALGLGAAPVGAFEDDAVAAVLSLRASEEPLYLIAVGEPRE